MLRIQDTKHAAEPGELRSMVGRCNKRDLRDGVVEGFQSLLLDDQELPCDESAVAVSNDCERLRRVLIPKPVVEVTSEIHHRRRMLENPCRVFVNERTASKLGLEPLRQKGKRFAIPSPSMDEQKITTWPWLPLANNGGDVMTFSHNDADDAGMVTLQETVESLLLWCRRKIVVKGCELAEPLCGRPRHVPVEDDAATAECDALNLIEGATKQYAEVEEKAVPLLIAE